MTPKKTELGIKHVCVKQERHAQQQPVTAPLPAQATKACLKGVA